MTDRTYIIISCTTNSKLYGTACLYTHYKLSLKPFTIEQRRSYIETFFHHFNKVSTSKYI